MNRRWVVITSINTPNARLTEFVALGYNVCVVGDRKTKDDAWLEFRSSGVTYLAIDEQRAADPEFSDLVGYDTYARKNFGYLFALRQGATTIWETDDDTFPRIAVGEPLEYLGGGRRSAIRSDRGGVWNPYEHFAPGHQMWPRGLPLSAIRDSLDWTASAQSVDVTATDIIQTLVNLEPDFDAIFRLTTPGTRRDFDPVSEMVVLDANVVSPGNTQSTIFLSQRAMPFMYFPVGFSDRYADIVKMYVAQVGCSMGYAGFLTEQFRNPHDLMRDFAEEVEMYRGVGQLVGCIRELRESNNAGLGMLDAYTALLASGIGSSRNREGASLFQEAVLRILNE